MAENGNNGSGTQPDAQVGAQAGAALPKVTMKILAQYIRDMSFENAVAQKGLQGTNMQPDIQVQVSLDARKRDTEHQYEIITKFKISSSNKADKATLFLLELEYAGVFHIEGVPKEQMHPFLLIECPRMLFPFVRRIVSDVTRDGGFPPLNLDNVDFMALYRQELQRQAELRKAEGGAQSATQPAPKAS
jgi:preprotein translocase subunit SecB